MEIINDSYDVRVRSYLQIEVKSRLWGIGNSLRDLFAINFLSSISELVDMIETVQ